MKTQEKTQEFEINHEMVDATFPKVVDDITNEQGHLVSRSTLNVLLEVYKWNMVSVQQVTAEYLITNASVTLKKAIDKKKNELMDNNCKNAQEIRLGFAEILQEELSSILSEIELMKCYEVVETTKKLKTIDDRIKPEDVF